MRGFLIAKALHFIFQKPRGIIKLSVNILVMIKRFIVAMWLSRCSMAYYNSKGRLKLSLKHDRSDILAMSVVVKYSEEDNLSNSFKYHIFILKDMASINL